MNRYGSDAPCWPPFPIAIRATRLHHAGDAFDLRSEASLPGAFETVDCETRRRRLHSQSGHVAGAAAFADRRRRSVVLAGKARRSAAAASLAVRADGP